MAETPFSLPLILLLVLSLPPSLSLQLQGNISAADLQALRVIKNTLTDLPHRRSPSGPGFFSTWDFSSLDPCSSFSGVVCDLGRVTILSLGTGGSDSPGLAGSLPAAISDLSELTQLILFPGIVTGPIPPQLGYLRNLRVLSLTNNRLTGTIPDTLSALFRLHTLDLSHNQLAGIIPPTLTKLPDLKILILSSNQFFGEIPADISSPLLHLDLKSNRLNGTLPRSLPSSLRYLSLSENSLWGPLRDGLDSLSELVYLDLSVNLFSGPIPFSLFSRPSLSSLLLQRNSFSGKVPPLPEHTSPVMYGVGSVVDLSHNNLYGEMSAIFAGVETLFLNNNRLIGSIPVEYVKSVRSGSTTTLYLQHNFISGFPLEAGADLPDTAALCLSYNCMEPPVGVQSCPASVGASLSRPPWQCPLLKSP
ncbi:LRR receptor-like serine/threonine-protein kinase GSO1 [Cucurbita moschata]|uniref:LRR receptor-like serine/threonine-protein kinase GSO1 n=1 Tax=Cucurbita moschata TaxID=3662 RepID=A0A6J1FRR2_CUCMO|nr:LRR receptor-like serine/threonine-protein kinase GSO1 [Cucurbita moschata]XP_022940811.1 LRR receptor-like serine/threonine-protein kinase GSO1 [Cucurbita moschata]